MRKLLVAAIVCGAVGMIAQLSRAEDKGTKATVTGVLIDQGCGAKMMKKDDPEKAAEAHTKACAVKCADSGYGVISGKKMIKFDDKGNTLAKEYFEKNDSTKVKVEGTQNGDEIQVTSIEPAADAK